MKTEDKDHVKGKQEVLYGLCGACKKVECATLVYLEDGIVTKIEGNPDVPPNYGLLCDRGASEILSLYNPYRLKSPLIRTNPDKGLDVDPKWKKVTWDEALDLVARRLKKVRDKDPRGLVICSGEGNEEGVLRLPFCKTFGTPNLIASRGPLCTIHYASCLVHADFPSSVPDIEHCQYLLTFGGSLGPNIAATGSTRRFAKAIERGMKLVVVDPRSSYEAAKGEWIPIRPGSDFAFLLAMAHVILHEGLRCDMWFMKNRTNAPYLIGPDGNYYRDPDTGKPMMWDPVENRARTFDADFEDITLTGAFTVNGVACRTAFDLVKEEFFKYTPEWAEKICTVPAETIRRIAGEFVENARIGSTIEIDGFTFPFRPASVRTFRAVTNHRGGTYADLTGKIINMLVGNLEVPGGVVGDGVRGPVMLPDKDGVVTPYGEAVPMPFTFPPEHIDCHEFYPNKHTGPHLAAKAILEPEKYHHDYRIEAWMTLGSNPVRKVAQPQVFVEAIKKIPFVVSIAYHMDETAILADVILPDNCALERHLVKVFKTASQNTSKEVCGLHQVYIRQPVPPVFDTMNMDDIFHELAERMGILYGKGGLYDHINQMKDTYMGDDGLSINEENKLELDQKHTLEEISDRRLKSWRHDGRGIDELKRAGAFTHWGLEKEFYNYYYHPENKTRHPFYFQHLKTTGEELRANLEKHNISFPGIDDPDYIFDLYRPIPHWVENSEFRAPEEFDLWVINWRTPYFSNDSTNVLANPWLVEVTDKDPFENGVYMNSGTAQKKNLEEGDTVVVESRYGKAEGILRITELLHPDALGIPGCGGIGTIQSNPVLKRGANWNALLPLDEKTLDPVSAGIECSPRVKVYRKAAKG
ncbi:MAG: molybdopterin-dependent oxidoreductase [Deltaproteobacteria bacterium]|nr:molybdopterin-dependent oxidoreductase [Deltaproteobacteria bacterium]